MTLWGRRLLMFAIVLGFGLVVAHTARRLNTAHASARNAPAPAATLDTVAATATKADAGASTEFSGGTPGLTPPPRSARVSAHGTPRPAAAAGGLVAGSGTMMHTFHDRNYKVSFDYPASWQFTERDHEISTFRLDARSAEKKTVLRAVTAIPENPYPASTFTGAYVYLSVTPHSNQQRCEQQAALAESNHADRSEIGGLSFVHGHDEQKHICTVERDEIYTTYRKGACYRFDLAINNFCGGEVSGVKDVTKQELDTVLTRMESIMDTVRFDPK